MIALKGTLTQLVKEYRTDILEGNRVLLKDSDGHFSLLYKSGDRVAFQFQDGFAPVLYPPMQYEFVSSPTHMEAWKALGLDK